MSKISRTSSIVAFYMMLLVSCGAMSRAVINGKEIPFTSAIVTVQGLEYTLKWRTGVVQSVKIYAGTDPMRIGTERLVASGKGDDIVTVSDLPPKTRWYFKLVPVVGHPLVLASRSLNLASASNFRDVGGYRTEEGKWVRMDVAYRSNGLGTLTATDYEKLKDLGLHLVCDLRLDEERLKLPDPELPGTRTLLADVSVDSSHRIANLPPLTKTGDDAAVHDFIEGVYRDFVDLPGARKGYHDLLERLADPDSLPTVFHCTAGKDRTGWAQAILLTILRVPRETILEDYRLTDQYISPNAIQQIRRSFPGADKAMSRALLSADPAFLETSFREAEQRFGSFEGYLRYGLGIDGHTIAAIRANFLAN
jgi:protein-tyrosine phosphatase